MKKITLVFLVIISFSTLNCLGKGRSFSFKETDIHDIRFALEMMGMEFHKIKFPIDSLQSYDITLTIDEYSKREIIDTRNISLRPTTERVIYPGEKETTLYYYDLITFILDENGSDPHSLLHFKTPRIVQTLILPTQEEHAMYSSRPFQEQAFETGKKIPFIMYGASWWDENIQYNRFCGSDQVDAAMENEFFDLSPHYFIISLIFTENNEGTKDFN